MKIFSLFKLEDFRYIRILRGVNLLVQVFLAILFIGGLNYLASLPAFNKRWDIDTTGRHSLSVESQIFLDTMARRFSKLNNEEPLIRIVMTAQRASAGDSKEETFVQEKLYRQISDLLDAFRYTLEGVTKNTKWLSFEHANLLKDTRLISEIRQKGAEISNNTAIVILSKTRCRTIDAGEFVRVSRSQESNAVDYFRGEEVLMSRLLEVTDTHVPIIYSLYGDGELNIDDTNPRVGLSEFARHLRSRNMRVARLNLSAFPDVPEDASMLLIANPSVPVSPLTQEKLIRYLRERNGRILLFVGPGRREIGLEDLLFEWGIQLKDVYVVERNPANILADNNVAMHVSKKGQHKVSEILRDLELPIVASQFREVCADIGAKEDGTRRVSEIIESSSQDNILTSWSEQDYRRPPYRFDEGRDRLGPVPVVTIAERVAGTRLGVNIPGGRLIVIGAADLATNSQLENGGNKPFLMNAINWLVEREMYLNIPPRPISDFRLKATMPDLTRIAWSFSFIPLGIALLGLIVAFWRRRA